MMTEEEQSLAQELDRLIGILTNVVDDAERMLAMATDLTSHAEARKQTEKPTWGEITRVARMVDVVDNHSDDMKSLRFRLAEMDADLQFILGGV